MEYLHFVVQFEGCPPEFFTRARLLETLRSIAAENLHRAPDDIRVWRWTNGHSEEITLRKTRGVELPGPERYARATWWWIAEGAQRDPYAAVPAIDGPLEQRLLQAFDRAADDFTDFYAEDLAGIALRAFTAEDRSASATGERAQQVTT